MTASWCTLPEAAKHLRVSAPTLRARMRSAFDPRVFVDIGTGVLSKWRVDMNLLDDWWRATCQQSTNATDAGGSAGATPTARNARASSPTAATPKRSNAKSTTTKPSADRGSLVLLAGRLTSRPA
jgi:hypothetical protein